MTGIVPRYEYRFSNGDVIFTFNEELEHPRSADIVFDHEEKVVLRNLHGEVGKSLYEKMFPKQATKTDFLINANVKLKHEGEELQVWNGEQLVASIKEDCNVHFAIWRLFNRLSA